MKICAYHGNLYLDAFIDHVEEMRSKGFDTILLCITETDMLYNMETFREFRTHALLEGMAIWATFWGLTAGEAIIKDGDIGKWLNAVKSIGINDVMIDEPKHIDDITDFTDNKFMDYHLCMTDDGFYKMNDATIQRLPVKSLGVSCYHWVNNWGKIATRTAAICTRLIILRPDRNFVFIQGFDIPERFELLPTIVKEVAEETGIKNFGFWSFRATAATSSKRPVNHKLIWDSIKM